MSTNQIPFPLGPASNKLHRPFAPPESEPAEPPFLEHTEDVSKNNDNE